MLILKPIIDQYSYNFDSFLHFFSIKTDDDEACEELEADSSTIEGEYGVNSSLLQMEIINENISSSEDEETDLNVPEENLNRVRASIKDYINLFCNICSKKSHNAKSTQIHRLKHFKSYPNGDQVYKCCCCPNIDHNTEKDLKDHYIEKFNVFFECCKPTCQERFRDRTDFVRHLYECLEVKKHNCDECCFFAQRKNYLKHHKKYHRIQYEHKCSKCSFSADDKKIIDFHEKRHHKD